MAPRRTPTLGACNQVHDDFCSSHRNARGTLASYSSLGNGRDGTSPPGGGLSIPFPRAGIDPTSVDVTSAGRISTRMVLRRLAAVSRETGSQPPRSAPHLPLQSGGARRDFRILCPSPMHGNLISTCQSRCIFHTLPSQHNAFHPIGRDLLDGRPPVSI